MAWPLNRVHLGFLGFIEEIQTISTNRMTCPSYPTRLLGSLLELGKFNQESWRTGTQNIGAIRWVWVPYSAHGTAPHRPSNESLSNVNNLIVWPNVEVEEEFVS